MKRQRRWTTRRMVGIAILVALLAACGQSPQVPGAPVALPLSGAIKDVPGKILFDRTSAWWTYEPSTEQKQELLSFPEQTFPATPAVSPDGKTVVFSVFTYGKGPDDPAYGTDLYVMKPDGTESRVLLAHEAPAESLSDPTWSPDGSMIYFTRRSPQGDSRIERMRADGSERKVVLENAQNPTVSGDGQTLAYMTLDPKVQMITLMVARADGSNPQPLLKDRQFQSIAGPRFAPTGNLLVFGGVPPQAASSGQRQAWGLFDWLQPRAALAHGVPWDLWVINADGSNLRQLTKVQEDVPIPAWSPDGAWVAFKGEMGLYVVDVAGGKVRRVADDIAASIAWLP